MWSVRITKEVRELQRAVRGLENARKTWFQQLFQGFWVAERANLDILTAGEHGVSL